MKRKATIVVLVAVAAVMSSGQSEPSLADQVATLIDLLEDLKQGAIIPFAASACPSGWAEFPNSGGRFLIGASERVPQGDHGGSPDHFHDGVTRGDGGGAGADNDNDFTASTRGHVHSYTTNLADHLPPYVAVTFCQLNE